MILIHTLLCMAPMAFTSVTFLFDKLSSPNCEWLLYQDAKFADTFEREQFVRWRSANNVTKELQTSSRLVNYRANVLVLMCVIRCILSDCINCMLSANNEQTFKTSLCYIILLRETDTQYYKETLYVPALLV